MGRRRNVPVPVPAPGGGVAASDLPGSADAFTIDLPMPIIRPYVAPYSPEFRHQSVLLTRSRNVPVTDVARDLGISIDTLRDWIAQARHDRRQLHEGTLSETVQAELVRLRADNHRLLRDALAIVVGWGASDVLDARLAGNALRMALHRRRPATGRELVHHSDRGSTYTASAFQPLRRQAGITCSMGRPGTCLNNAVAETFFATLKVELIHRRSWPSRADVVQAIFASVKMWYAPEHRLGSLGYLSPVASEASVPSASPAPKPMTVR